MNEYGRYVSPFEHTTGPSRRRESKGMVAATWAVIAIGVAAIWAVETYLVMLLVGAIHLEVWDKLPPFGFLQVFLIELGLFIVGAYFRMARR